MIKNIKNFLIHQIWEIETKEVSKVKKYIIQQLRLFLFIFQNFKEDKCSIIAESLTYTTLLSIVPVMAIFFFLLKIFGGLESFQLKIKIFLSKNLLPEAGEQIHNFITKFIETIHSGTIGTIGFIILIIITTSLFGKVEDAFNHIWGVKKSRSPIKKITFYWSIVSFGSALIAISLFLTSTLKSQLFFKKIYFTGFSYFIIYFLLPLLLTYIGFCLLYTFLTNTKVKFRFALYGGIIAGTLWEIAKYGYNIYLNKIFSPYKIYGPLGAMFIFLIWLYIFWLLVLLGAEIAFAHQNLKTFADEKKAKNISIRLKENLTIQIMIFISYLFLNNKSPPTAEDISQKFHIPIKITNDIINDLIKFNFINAVVIEKNYIGYQPAKSPENINISQIIQSIKSSGEDFLKIKIDQSYEKIDRAINTIYKSALDSFSEVTVKDLTKFYF